MLVLGGEPGGGQQGGVEGVHIFLDPGRCGLVVTGPVLLDLRDMALLVPGSSRLLVYSSVSEGMHSNWGWGREGW